MTIIDQDGLKARLSKQAYDVTQHKATEAPFSGKFVDHHEGGMTVWFVANSSLPVMPSLIRAQVGRALTKPYPALPS